MSKLTTYTGDTRTKRAAERRQLVERFGNHDTHAHKYAFKYMQMLESLVKEQEPMDFNEFMSFDDD